MFDLTKSNCFFLLLLFQNRDWLEIKHFVSPHDSIHTEFWINPPALLAVMGGCVKEKRKEHFVFPPKSYIFDSGYIRVPDDKH